MDPQTHPIFSNSAIMRTLKKFFNLGEWECVVCALRNPMNEHFDLCHVCNETGIITIGDHYIQPKTMQSNQTNFSSSSDV